MWSRYDVLVDAHVEPFFEPVTQTLTYVVHAGTDAVVIDPVLDYDPIASQTATRALEAIAEYVSAHSLSVHWSLETHPHADHLSGARWIARRFGARIAIGARVTEVQAVFRDVYQLGDALPADGRQFDRLLADGDVIEAGRLRLDVMATPGHTPACVTYRCGDTVFTGDALFIHDYGTGRCDFPRGSAAALYDSIKRLYALPDDTRVCPCHDYLPGGRPLVWHTTIGRSKAENVQLTAATTRDEFVAFRVGRDKTLAPPRLLWPAVQMNLAAGRLPPGRLLRIPINRGRATDDDAIEE
jgi:glyoxylase-like metal-dependent hydrolase (beta-lactamase superfamily II)